MPYIRKARRDSLDTWDRHAHNAGELNYVITKAAIDYACYKIKSSEESRYQVCNDVVGALENAKDEFQRRIQHPYEDRKMHENDDVYSELLQELMT